MGDFGLGGIPSPPDPRDFDLPLDTATPVPAGWLIGINNVPRVSMAPHLNQGNTPMCGGYSGATLKRQQEKADGNGVRRLDAPWLYRRSRVYAGLPSFTEGTTARGVLAALLHEGIPDVDTGVHYRIKSYAAVPRTTDALCRALMQYQSPVLLGIRWPANWSTSSTWHPAGSLAPKPSAATQGGHLIVAIGWRTVGGRVQFLLFNTWGTVWAGKGNLWVWADDLFSLIHDSWKALDA